jgi:shikimate kinase
MSSQALRRNVFLIGPMGSGKTAVGKQLARLLDLTFYDSDVEIERRTGVDIPYIFEKEGETGFREREREVIDSLTQLEDVVIATGGGAVLLPENRERLAARGSVVYLRTGIRQQLERTEVRAPFDGFVSNRKVSAGDTAQVGKELLHVIDPYSLRFEGLISDDNIGEVRDGQAVWFRIHGFGERDFTGKVTRVNPAANVTTRQVEVLVSFDDAKQQPNVAGLYAEGRVDSQSVATLALPSATVVREGDSAYAWHVRNGKLRKAPVTLGDRDARTGAYMLKAGLNEGDQVLRFPNVSLKEDQPVTFDGGIKGAVVAEK